jgi:hypothetical protein
VGVSSRAEVKTTREVGADREKGHIEGDSEAAVRTIRTAVPRCRTARREGERMHRSIKKETGEHTDIRHTMLSSTRRRATLNTSGGPTTNVQVGKEAAKVSEMGGCARQC